MRPGRGKTGEWGSCASLVLFVVLPVNNFDILAAKRLCIYSCFKGCSPWMEYRDLPSNEGLESRFTVFTFQDVDVFEKQSVVTATRAFNHWRSCKCMSHSPSTKAANPGASS